MHWVIFIYAYHHTVYFFRLVFNNLFAPYIYTERALMFSTTYSIAQTHDMYPNIQIFYPIHLISYPISMTSYPILIVYKDYLMHSVTSFIFNSLYIQIEYVYVYAIYTQNGTVLDQEVTVPTQDLGRKLFTR